MTDRDGDTSIDPQELDSGRYQDVCPDCGTTIVGVTPDDVLGATCACEGRRAYRYLTELVCTLCSREVATVVTGQPNASIWVPRQLRCQYCGGQPLAGETVRQVVYPRVPLEQPRRGRPPRWLAEQRRLDTNAS
jgi:DNA-directed RNA polymerase subunit RPC12/RpoP